MVVEAGKAWRQDGFVTGYTDEDVLGVVRANVEPIWIIKGACIYAAGVNEPLEFQEELGSASVTEVNVDHLATALGPATIDHGSAFPYSDFR